jgi:hypothetical protein
MNTGRGLKQILLSAQKRGQKINQTSSEEMGGKYKTVTGHLKKEKK